MIIIRAWHEHSKFNDGDINQNEFSRQKGIGEPNTAQECISALENYSNKPGQGLDHEWVKEVKNERTVAMAENKPQTVGAMIDDASLTARVKMTLLYHRWTSVLNTEVGTNDGVVTMYARPAVPLSANHKKSKQAWMQ